MLRLFLILSPLFAWAQTGTGRIQGTVRDVSGGLIPAAQVAATNAATGVSSQASTNESGVFVVPALPGGTYTLTVTAGGMETYTGRLELAVGQTADIPVMLKVASAQTTVSVTEEATQLITSESPTVAANLENERLQQLPLNGRFLQNMILQTVPGLEGNSGTPRVFGMREGAMEFTLDGAVLSNRFNTGLVARPPGLDSVSEVRVETSVPSAKLNRPATAILSTKSGTNEWHGSAFYTARNNAFGVARRREQLTAAPKLIRNEYGATLGGPVILPKLYNGRNRTFFFGAWEDYRIRQNSDRQARIATAAMRQGDFSDLRDGLGRQTVIYDPNSTANQALNWARTPFPGNRIPGLRQSPLSKNVYAQVPLPNFPDINPNVAANFLQNYPDKNDHRTLTFRGDHRLSSKHSVFGRYSRGTTFQFQPAFEARPAPVFLDGTGNVKYQETSNQSVAGNWLYVLTPSLFVETAANWSTSQFYSDRANPAAALDVAKQWGLPNPKGYPGIPDLINIGFELTTRGPFADDNRNTAFNLDQNFSKLSGKHQFEFGWHWREDSVYVVPRQYPNQVEIAFNSNATALYDPRTGNAVGAMPQTGHEAANFFLGVAGQYNVGIRRPDYTIRTGEWAGFLQDNWRLTPKLTLNLGVRWEYFSPFREKSNNMVGFDIPSNSIVLGNTTQTLIQQGQTTAGLVRAYEQLGAKFTTPAQVGLPAGFVNRDWNNVNPRAGLAYRTALRGRTLVLRGGFGGYHFPIPTRTYHQPLRGNAPFDATAIASVTRADQSPDGLPNYGMRSAPAIIAGQNSLNAIDLNAAIPIGRGFNVHHMLPDMPTPRAYEWNFTTEYEFLPKTVLRLGYTGTAGRDQEQWEALNIQKNEYVWFTTTGQPLPTGAFASTARRTLDKQLYGEMRIYRPEAFNNFHGARIEVQRRYAQGLAFQFFYMFSHAMGTGWAPSNSGYSDADEVVSEAEAFLPNAVPQDYKSRARFLTYKRDEGVPHHRFNWNFLVDLPFGQGKRLLDTKSRWVNLVAGGWQVAGLGNWRSRWFQLPDTNWGPTGKPVYYGTQHQVQDCRSGQCFPGYLYYNGYISAQVLNQPRGVTGVPESYVASHAPVNPAPAPGQASGLPANFWDTNFIDLRLNNGSTVRTNANNNLHPWRTQIAPGPWNFGMDASLFKFIPVTERVRLRLNFDAFNVFNSPGLPMPDAGTGIISLRNSNNGPRQIQVTGRLEW